MDKNCFLSFVKPLAYLILWLSATLTGITALLSAIGYLVIHSHQDLLGIVHIIPISIEYLIIEGARFVYNSLFFLIGGLFSNILIFFLIVFSLSTFFIVLLPRWKKKLHTLTASPIIKSLILCFVIFTITVNFICLFLFVEPSHLLLEIKQYDTEIYKRSTETGIKILRIRYAQLLSMLIFSGSLLNCLPPLLGIKILKKTSPPLSETNIYHLIVLILWGCYLINFILLPINYGKLAKSNYFYKVRIIKKIDDKFEKYKNKSDLTKTNEGWLLYEGKEKIVLYKGMISTNPICIFNAKNYDQIQILEHGNIFIKK